MYKLLAIILATLTLALPFAQTTSRAGGTFSYARSDNWAPTREVHSLFNP